ncbi:MAG: AMP-binding protein [Actinobacteria bacterium]|nr:AMP-binding protein [Actinomycetota bacterium]
MPQADEASTAAVASLPDAVLAIARSDPHRLAAIEVPLLSVGAPKVRTTTYATLSHRAESVAVGLREIGVHEGTLCSFMVPPGADAMVLALALMRVGASMVGIEPHSHGLRKIAQCLRRVGPEFFFGSPEAQLARKVFGWGAPSVHTSIVVGPRRVPGALTLVDLERPWLGQPKAPAIDLDTPALIAFTTGSTGSPKPTVMTQRNFAAMIDGVSRQWDLGAHGDVVDMPTFPIFWIIGLSQGGTVVVPPMNFATRGPGDANPARLVDTIRRFDVHSMFASPALLANLSRYCNERQLTLPSIRRIVAGGAEIQGPLFAEVKRVIPAGELYSNYGATEALPVAEIDGDTVLGTTWPRTERGHGVCVGTPLAGVEVRIVVVDDGPIETMDDARVLGTNEIGEVVVRSPHVSDRYYDAPGDMAANKIVDGTTRWHRLGDCGFVDEDGRLWVCGRTSHRVVGVDRTWFALCCEPVFNAHPSVARTALIRIDDPDSSAPPTPAVCVEPAQGVPIGADRLVQELRDLAIEYEATRGIERFIIVDKLPVDRRHNAKIDRPALSATYSAAEAATRAATRSAAP